MVRNKYKLVLGVGINDADYNVQPYANGKQGCCKIYQKWKDMLRRCYSKNQKTKHPSYVGCVVSEDWLRFSNFRKWCVEQNNEDGHLDKDLLSGSRRGKLYSSQTCVLISRSLNNFLQDRKLTTLPTGVLWKELNKKYQARCCNPFTGKRESLGMFDCEMEAHFAYAKRKREHALVFADNCTDLRIRQALLVMDFLD